MAGKSKDSHPKRAARAPIDDLFGPAPEDTADANSFANSLSNQSGHESEPSVTETEAQAPSVLALPQALPAGLHLGTSSWSFPGWAGIVYDEEYSASKLARQGLKQYARTPLLRCVCIDRSFYAPLTVEQFGNYRKQVPEGFRFVIKAPSLVADATIRNEAGHGQGDNPYFLDVASATTQFVQPCIEGLGDRAGVLVFQLSPLPYQLLGDIPMLIQRIGQFFDALPRLPAGTWYALELRNAELLTPRLIRQLNECGVRYCIGIHSRMPPAQRQIKAWQMQPPGPLVVRWNLHAGLSYEQARTTYAPFDRMVNEDLPTRQALAGAISISLGAGQQVFMIANNNAEGCAPLTLHKLALELADRL